MTDLKKSNLEAYEERAQEEFNLLDIWTKHNASRRDKSFSEITAKCTFLGVIVGGIILLLVSYTQSILLPVSAGIGLLILFVVSFHAEIFSIRTITLFPGKEVRKIDPFSHIKFWQVKQNKEMIFITNEKDYTCTGAQFLRIDVLPETIHVHLHDFLTGLSLSRTKEATKIPAYLSFQTVHVPYTHPYSDPADRIEKYSHMHTEHTMKTEIYITVHYTLKGTLTASNMSLLMQILQLSTRNVLAKTKSNFFHHKISLLSGNDLINGVRTYFFKEKLTKSTDVHMFLEGKKKVDPNDIYRGFTCLVIGGLYVFIFAQLIADPSVLFWAQALVLIGFPLSLIQIWWRNLRYRLKRKRIHTADLVRVLPFKDADFYRVRPFSETLFIHINQSLIVGLKSLNLVTIHAKDSFRQKDKFNKFYREVMGENPFVMTYLIAPMDYATAEKESAKYMNERARRFMQRHESEEARNNWLTMRGGMWKMIYLLNKPKYLYAHAFTLKAAQTMEQSLREDAALLNTSLATNLEGWTLEHLSKNRLYSGVLASFLNTNLFRKAGSHLQQNIIQGKVLANLLQIQDELKGGVETRLPVEYNAPLSLENFIELGYVFNTEEYKNLIPFGFTEAQCKRLLITNGSQHDRDTIRLKIASELTKVESPVIYFDFTGDSSKLIRLYERTDYDDKFLYFKLGSSFNLDLLKSGIPYDTENIKYLDYMMDACSLVFKKGEAEMEAFRNNLLNQPDLDFNSAQLSTLALEEKNQPAWKKNPIGDFILTLFNEIPQRDGPYLYGHTLTGGQVEAHDFLKDEKTILLDLSELSNADVKLFAAFVILCKIIHYVKYHQGEAPLIPKIISLPNIDLVFDRKTLSSSYKNPKKRYTMIGKFLDPLFREGFGYIFGANNASELSDTLFTYFKDIICLVIYLKQDAEILRKVLHLREYTGSGAYSHSRKNQYQVDQLSELKDNEAVIKRSDVNQAFQAIIEWDEILAQNILARREIQDYMRNQGFDLETAERRIRESVRKSKFERDLGPYYAFIKEIKRMFEALGALDKIGGLYKPMIKEQIKYFLYSPAKKTIRGMDSKRKFREFSEGLFVILVERGYLVESHPLGAAGGETVRTSYSIGAKYEEALEDELEAQFSEVPEISIDILEKETSGGGGLEKMGIRKETYDFWKDFQFKEDLFKLVGSTLLAGSSEMKYALIQGQYEDALKKGRSALRKLLIHMALRYLNYDSSKKITNDVLEQVVAMLSEKGRFPLSKEEADKYIYSPEIQMENLGEDSKREEATRLKGLLAELLDRLMPQIFGSHTATNSQEQKGESV